MGQRESRREEVEVDFFSFRFRSSSRLVLKTFLHFSLSRQFSISLSLIRLPLLSPFISISIAMRGAAARLLLSPCARRAWQQHAGSGGMEAILPSTSISLPSSSSSSSFFSSTSSTSSSSSSPPTPFHLLDRVFVTRMPFFARHGVHPAEAQLGQRFEVDAEVFIDGLAGSVLAEEGGGKGRDAESPKRPSSPKGPKSPKSSSSVVPADSVSRTFDYSRIHAVAQRVVRDGPRAQLVETLAARIADALLLEEEENEEHEGKEKEKEKESSSSSSSSSSFLLLLLLLLLLVPFSRSSGRGSG